MQYLLIGVVVTALGLWLMRQPATKKRRYVTILLSLLLAAVLIFLLVSGRAGLIVAFFAALLPFARRLAPLLRWLPILKWFRRNKSVPSDGSSEVATNELRMILDHTSGKIDGEVLVGHFKGKLLSELAFVELINLYEFCQQNQKDTKALLVNYLEKMRVDEWRQYQASNAFSGNEQAGSASDTMSLDEAYRLLDVHDGATEQEIIKSHRRLMARVHPDKGGSSYLAARLNEAKELLLSVVKK